MRFRILSAVIGLPFLYLFVFLGTGPVGGLVIVIAAVSGYEISRMAIHRHRLNDILTVLIPMVACGMGMLITYNQTEWWPLGAAIIFTLIVASLIQLSRQHRNRSFFKSILATIYFGTLLAHAPALRAIDENGWWMLTMLLTTFSVDSAGFFVGKAIGRHKLVPKISPGKSWEGAAGGIVAGIVVSMACASALNLGISLLEASGIGFIIAMVAITGDLAESMLKRYFGVKESGWIVPGHGGILDRLDSLAPNFAVVYWLTIWVNV